MSAVLLGRKVLIGNSTIMIPEPDQGPSQVRAMRLPKRLAFIFGSLLKRDHFTL